MSRENALAAVWAEAISFCYGGEPVLNRVGFTVSEGEFVAVVGANGAGKSTLLRLLLGELSPLGGAVRLFGEDVRHFQNWRRIGYVPQNGAAIVGRFPATALEVVSANLYGGVGVFRPGRKEAARLSKEALRRVGMEHCAGRLIGTLSGGQLQRVLIARVLVRGCALLLLDEPVTGVDSESVSRLYQLLQALNREEGITIVMVTHDMAKAAVYVDKALCLEEGTVVELDREQIRHELYHRHKHPPFADGERG